MKYLLFILPVQLFSQFNVDLQVYPNALGLAPKYEINHHEIGLEGGIMYNNSSCNDICQEYIKPFQTYFRQYIEASYVDSGHIRFGLRGELNLKTITPKGGFFIGYRVTHFETKIQYLFNEWRLSVAYRFKKWKNTKKNSNNLKQY